MADPRNTRPPFSNVPGAFRRAPLPQYRPYETTDPWNGWLFIQLVRTPRRAQTTSYFLAPPAGAAEIVTARLGTATYPPAAPATHSVLREPATLAEPPDPKVKRFLAFQIPFQFRRVRPELFPPSTLQPAPPPVVRVALARLVPNRLRRTRPVLNPPTVIQTDAGLAPKPRVTLAPRVPRRVVRSGPAAPAVIAFSPPVVSTLGVHLTARRATRPTTYKLSRPSAQAPVVSTLRVSLAAQRKRISTTSVLREPILPPLVSKPQASLAPRFQPQFHRTTWKIRPPQVVTIPAPAVTDIRVNMVLQFGKERRKAVWALRPPTVVDPFVPPPPDLPVEPYNFGAFIDRYGSWGRQDHGKEIFWDRRDFKNRGKT